MLSITIGASPVLDRGEPSRGGRVSVRRNTHPMLLSASSASLPSKRVRCATAAGFLSHNTVCKVAQLVVHRQRADHPRLTCTRQQLTSTCKSVSGPGSPTCAST